MDAEHVVGPMTGRGEANAVGIFHLSEGSLDVMLAAIAKDDLLVGEIGAIGEQNPLAQNTLLKFPVGFLIRSKGNPESPAFARDLAPKKILDVLAGNNGVQILLNIRYRVGLAPPAGFMAADDSFLKIAQGTHLFGQMLPDAPDLPSKQGAAAGDDDRALPPKDLLLGAIRAHPGEGGIVQGMKLLQRNVQ